MTTVSGISGTQPSSRGLLWWVTKHGRTVFRTLLNVSHFDRSVFMLFQGILNPMQAFLNTLAFHGWTGLDVDLSLQRRREMAWDSVSTSVPNTGGHNPIVGATLLYQSHVQEAKKGMMGNGQQHSDAISVLSEGNWALSGSNGSPVYQGW